MYYCSHENKTVVGPKWVRPLIERETGTRIIPKDGEHDPKDFWQHWKYYRRVLSVPVCPDCGNELELK